MNQADALVDYIKTLGPSLVALSGGVDSCVLAVAARKALGREKMFAVTGDSATLPSADREYVTQFCEQQEIPHMFVGTYEYENPNYQKNPANRCFYCKEELYRRLWEVAREKKLGIILDGTNLSDLQGHRPGFQALQEAKITTPFVALEFDKAAVRFVARAWNLEVADKPQSACLASRVPTGTPIQLEALQEIDQAEKALRAFGFRQVRVRHHGKLARVELTTADWILCLKNHEAVVASLKEIGFQHVTLDLVGYSRGI